MINLFDESMEATPPAGALAPIPATSFVEAKEGSPLFRMIRVMPRDERNPLVARPMEILCRRILLAGCQTASPAQPVSRLTGRLRGL